MSREPIRLITAIEAGWMVLLGGSAFTDLIPHRVAGLLILGTAAAKAAAASWARSKVTPLADPKTSEGEPLRAHTETSEDVQARVAQSLPVKVETTLTGGAAPPEPDAVEPPAESAPEPETAVPITKRFP